MIGRIAAAGRLPRARAFALIAALIVVAAGRAPAEEPAPAADGTPAVSADDGLDGLFDDPADSSAEGGEAEEPADGKPADDGQAAGDGEGGSVLDRLKEKKGISFRGSFYSSAGLTCGWTDVPDFNDLSNGFFYQPGASMEALLGIDASPDPDFRFYAQVGARLGSEFSFTEFYLKELFADVSLGDIALLRIGQSKVTWGNGRIFSPANLASWADGTVNARLAFPTLLGGLTGIVAANTALYDSPSLEMLYSAAKLDIVLGGVQLSVMGGAQMNLGARAAMSLKTVIMGVDLVGEASLGYKDVGGAVFFPAAMAGFFKEWKGPGIILNAEYLFDSERYLLWAADPASYEKAGYNHAACVQFAWANLIGDLDFGLRWAHSFTEASGSAQAGFSHPLWNHVKLNLAFPVNYGRNREYYQEKFEEDDERASFLSAFGFGAGIGLGISAEF